MDYKKTAMWKEICETPDVLPRTLSYNKEMINKAAAAVRESGKHNFVLVGRGTSDHALMYFKNALEILTPYTAGLASNSVITLYNGRVNLSESIVVGCSQSGAGEDVFQYLKRANEQGALTLGITNYEDSKIAKECDYHLFCACGEEVSVAATKTFSAELYLLLLLAAELASDDALKTELANLPAALSEAAPIIDAETDAFSEKYGDMKDGFILSRGITYPIALEGALKLQETCYIKMKGYPSSDFYHGPMAMVDTATPVIVYAARFSGEPALKEYHFFDRVKCIDTMRGFSQRVLIVTDDAEISEKYSGSDVAFLGASYSEYSAMFKFALFAQSFACKISCRIGNNPDSPRALKKVTVTK